MKKSKSLSIMMAMMLATQGGGAPAVFAMKGKIHDSLLRILFFRPELISKLKEFLDESLPNMPEVYRTPTFSNYLRENHLINEEVVDKFQKHRTQEQELKRVIDERWGLNDEVAQKAQISDPFRQIIEKDDLESLRQQFDKSSKNIKVFGCFLGCERTEIPLLHYCVMKKAMKCFKFLVLNGADPEEKMLDRYFIGWDCMSLTVYFGEWEMMKILEERGIDKLNNPVVWEAAALTHRNKFLKLLLSQEDECSNFQECLNSAILGAAVGDNIKGAILLNEKAANVNVDFGYGMTPLYAAGEYGSPQVAKILIDKGAHINGEPSFWGCTPPLSIAAKSNAYLLVELLISKGADVNISDFDGLTPLHNAASGNAYEAAELLISKGADINAEDETECTPLHIAVRDRSLKVAELLISKGADIEATNCDGETPLHWAEDYDIANLLIEKGANINAITDEGETPLHEAAATDSSKVAELLISKGIDVNAKRNDGQTPLHVALDDGQTEVAELLISKGADINAKDNEGQTPLHVAAAGLSSKGAELLISKGADINARDNNGRTPLHVAKERQRGEIVKLLISKGGIE